MKLTDLITPVALIDLPRMQHNIERMQAQVASLGATFRPHVKTSKCVQATEAQIQAGAALFAAEIMARAVYDQSNSTMQAASLIGMAARELGENIVQAAD